LPLLGVRAAFVIDDGLQEALQASFVRQTLTTCHTRDEQLDLLLDARNLPLGALTLYEELPELSMVVHGGQAQDLTSKQ
jgi:hypothetical protein